MPTAPRPTPQLCFRPIPSADADALSTHTKDVTAKAAAPNRDQVFVVPPGLEVPSRIGGNPNRSGPSRLTAGEDIVKGATLNREARTGAFGLMPPGTTQALQAGSVSSDQSGDGVTRAGSVAVRAGTQKRGPPTIYRG